MKKRIYSIFLLLAVMTAGSAAAACGDVQTGNADSNAVESGSETVPAETEAVTRAALKSLPDADYGGYTFRIILNNQDDRFVDIMTAGEENGDIFNDIVFRRNSMVEEKYNITIVGTEDTYSNLNKLLQQETAAGSSTYDLYYSNCYATRPASSGYLYVLNDLPNLDLSNPWWDTAALKGMSIGGKNYLATGDISPTSLLTSSCFVFNKNLFTDYDMEFPYTMAAEGKWTLDQLIKMTKGLSVDLNGDGKMERDDDLFSLSCWSQDISISLFYGAGGMLSAKNEDDIPVIQWDVDRISSIYDKVYELIIDNKSNFVIDSKEYPTTYQTFSNGSAFFCEITLQKIDAFLRDMEDDYGILPLPKWDEAQPTYLSCVGGAGGFVVVPAIVSDPERTGMIFEALAAGAYDGITPSLYNVITKTRNVRDSESAQMVSLITSQRVFDPYLINMIDGYDFILQLLKSGGREVASTLEKSRSAAESKLQSIIDSYLAQN